MVVVKVNCTQEIFLETERERSSSIIFYLVLNLFSNWIIESVVGSKRTMKEVISGETINLAAASIKTLSIPRPRAFKSRQSLTILNVISDDYDM